MGSETPLRAQVVGASLVGMLGVIVSGMVAALWLQLGAAYVWRASALFGLMAAVVVYGVGRHHPCSRFGPANHVTLVRSALLSLVAALIGEPEVPRVAALGAVASTIGAALDGVDGWLARRSRMASRFGARFDMETDALLIMVLSVLVWRHEKAGVWVLLGGFMRYGFVVAGWCLPWMARPLTPTRRGQIVAASHTLGLCVALAPMVAAPLSLYVAAVSLAALSWSFAVDVRRLWKAAPAMDEVPAANPAPAWTRLAAALVLLNISLTFTNVWPTLAVWPTADVSIEVAVCVLALLMARRWRGVLSRSTSRWLAVIWVGLVVGRYVDVTVRSLYGRDLNLYWDLRLVPDVGAMFAVVASSWLIALAAAALIVLPVVIYLPVRWALGCVHDAAGSSRTRGPLGVLAGGVFLLWVAQTLGSGETLRIRVAEPVTQVYVREVNELFHEMTEGGAGTLAPPPPIRSDLSRVSGADVLVLFLESYGAVSWDRPDLAGPLASTRAHFDADIRDTGRAVVSAFVESTTFGGESWLAHISLLSGTEVRDQRTNTRLMAQGRDTLVTLFRNRGYQTIAIMPGLTRGWPEGKFYGFEEIHNLERLAYNGPPFGWWSITDQFALARMDAIGIAPQPRRPTFVFFPTISTHAPFTPRPPYQADWPRVLTPTPYDQADLDRAWSEPPDWLNLGPGYTQALAYVFESLGGYLRLRADRDLVMILIGDHQPPALVSGEGASWDVPVHVIASRPAVLDRLRQHKFREGLTPQHPALARMDELLPLLLDAFGDP